MVIASAINKTKVQEKSSQGRILSILTCLLSANSWHLLHGSIGRNLPLELILAMMILLSDLGLENITLSSAWAPRVFNLGWLDLIEMMVPVESNPQAITR